MNLKEEISREQTKAVTNKIVTWVDSSHARFEELLRLLFDEEIRLVQKAASMGEVIIRKYPLLLIPYLPEILEKLKDKNCSDTVKRNLLRILQGTDIPEEFEGELYQLCFSFLNDTDVPVAIKAFSVTVLENICKKYPELSSEVLAVIQDKMPFEKPAYKVRARRFISTFTANKKSGK